MQEALMLEERLIEAMLRSDIEALNHLISDSLIFINHVEAALLKALIFFLD